MTKEEYHSLFKEHYNSMCNYAFAMINNRDEAEDIVQGVFVDFWNKPDKETITAEFENYLIRSIKFKCIDFHRKEVVKRKYEEAAVHEQSQFDEEDNEENPALKDLINLSISQLPEKTQEVFRLSKLEGMSYKEIADQLGISPKTVENQMGRAFKMLREKLKNYKDLLILLFFLWME